MTREYVTVYGTLREGLALNRALEKHEKLCEARMYGGYILLQPTNSFFPCCVWLDDQYRGMIERRYETEIGPVVVDVYQVDSATMKQLDMIEGVPFLFNRIEAYAGDLYTLDDSGNVPVTRHPWMYTILSPDEDILLNARLVVNGDFKNPEYLEDFRFDYQQLVADRRQEQEEYRGRLRQAVRDIPDVPRVMAYGRAGDNGGIQAMHIDDNEEVGIDINEGAAQAYE